MFGQSCKPPEIASLSCLATIITFLSLLFLPILMNSEHYHQSTRTLERFATFQCWENWLPWRVLQAVYWLRARMYIWAPANLLCLLGVLIWPGKFMLQRATRKLKVLEEFVQIPIQSYTHLTHCSRKRHKQLQPALTKWLHLTGVAKCDPEAGKCVKETPLKPLQPLHFIDSIQSDAQITWISCVFTGIHLTHLLRRICGPSTISATWKASERKASAAGWSTSQAVRHPRHPAVTAKIPLGHIHDAT